VGAGGYGRLEPPPPPAPGLVRPASWPSDLDAVRRILSGYFDAYRADLGKQDFPGEMERLATYYDGRDAWLWVAEADGEAAGCIGLRRIDAGRCELKRMVVEPAARGRGLGAMLARHAVAEARRLGFEAVYLDTLPSMQSARRIYEALGFRACPPYYGSPLCGAVFMELRQG
jgi:ribosomal protein S18 acetylase RimI-like enzyme